MDQKRPRRRETHVTNNSTGVHKRGDGLGTGPVGVGDGYAGKKTGGSGGGGFGTRAKAGGGGLFLVIAIFIIKALLGGGGSSTSTEATEQASSASSAATSAVESIFSAVTGTSGGSSGASSSGAGGVSTSYSKLDRTVADGSRAKRTSIVGGGKDTVTLMIYMCGTDLESKHGMASSDLSEMAAAKFGDDVRIIVYTGGCKNWQTSGISSSVNQIYQVKDGGLSRLVKDDGSKAMTDPATLSAFIKWTAKNYPANRYDLIFWDHGGGSVSGYGYDEKFAKSGSMDLANINKALKAGGVDFDFIGFDACLMATAETALMLNEHADYMIASEETEPGIGWYYTNWLTKLGADTSMPTLDIGRNIVDDFVAQCGKRCAGQKTTLSVIDLAEFANTVPKNLASFSKSISKLIEKKEYKKVSDARYTTREFAASSKIDQIDLVNLCKNINNSEANALSKALQGAVKYNRTSSNMTDAYGVSIYFPYQRASYVDEMCDTYEEIGMDDNYAKCIRDFASLEVSGQAVAGGSAAASPLGSILGGLAGNMLGGGASSGSSEVIGQLLGAFLSGGRNIPIDGLSSKNSGFLSDGALTTDEAAEYISLNHFDASALTWDTASDGTVTMSLPQSQWDLVHAVDLNMFFDDGKGYIDLGLDNNYDFTEDGALVAATDGTWLAINGQPVAYYHETTVEQGNDYTITGRVPAMLNGQRVNLWLVFDNTNPHGYIAGAQYDYKEKATKTQAKSLTELKPGDKLDFLCDYYSYDGKYQDSYYLGEPMKVTNNMEISNVDVGGKVKLTYRFTDIYNQEYWSEAISR